MRAISSFFNKKEILTVFVIVLFLYPLICLLRSFPLKFIALHLHIREISFFLVAIFLSSKLLYFFHRFISAATLFHDKIIRSIIAEVLIIIIITPAISVAVFTLAFSIQLDNFPDPRMIILFTIILLFVQIAYLFFYHYADYHERFRTELISKEKLKYEKTVAQYQALQNHISPHFVFNSLSGLNTAIHRDPAIASETVLNFSDFLRHVLITLDKTTIPLSTELLFIQKYKFLLDRLTPDCIELIIDIAEEDKQKEIPPCILQLLVENAVKHNVARPEQKLMISIRSLAANRLEVFNNINRKNSSHFLSTTGTGLDNIKRRYSLLTEEPVSIEKTENKFSITIPLLNRHNNENPRN